MQNPKTTTTSPFSSAHTLAEAALSYAAFGWAVIPLHSILPSSGLCSCARPNCSSPAKHPLTANGLKDATTDAQIVRDWWTRWPNANIGIITGARSGGLVVVDFDGGKFDPDYFSDLETQVGQLPKDFGCQTGNGYHLYFYSTELLRNSASKIAPGVDVRGEGGYVVAPPSVHVSGRTYAWFTSCAPSPPALPEDWEETLLSAQSRPATGQTTTTPGNPSSSASAGQIIQGSRNVTMTSIAGKLRRAGLEQDELEVALLKINQTRCQPPLLDSEVQTIAKSVSRYAVPPDPDLTIDADDDPFADAFDASLPQDAHPEEARWSNLLPEGDFQQVMYKEGEQILHWYYRGELGELCSKPSVGKSTLALNLLLSMAAGRPFPPIYDGVKPRRVLYIDFENRPQRLQTDLAKMKEPFTDAERDLIAQNFIAMVDSKFDDKFFTMTDQGVLTSLAKIVKHRGIEFVVIDTLAQAVDLMDENSNAEMQRKVVRPFNQFAQASNAAVMWIHHMGKNNGEQGDAMFKSRGASSKSAGVRLQMNLEPASKDDNTFIMLQCAKLKGYEKFPDTKFYYDRDRRWFVDPQVAQVKQVTLEEKLYDYLNQGHDLSTAEICAEFAGINRATVFRTLTRLCMALRVEKVKQGTYRAIPDS